jgi:hypothetical protein
MTDRFDIVRIGIKCKGAIAIRMVVQAKAFGPLFFALLQAPRARRHPPSTDRLQGSRSLPPWPPSSTSSIMTVLLQRRLAHVSPTATIEQRKVPDFP